MITYKTLPAQPQFGEVFTDWDFAPCIAAHHTMSTQTGPGGSYG
jgi:uncharacterized protein DUF2092